MISALESTTNNDANGSIATHGGGGEEGGGEKGGATSMSRSAGIIFSSAKVEEREGEGEVGGAVSEPNLLKEKEERVERLILPTSPGTLSELLKARQLKKVSILFYYLNLYLSLSLLLVDHSWY